MDTTADTITYHDNIEQGSPEWLALKADKYSGSNAYKLLSSFGAGKHAMHTDSDFTGNFHTKRGHLLEDEALELYADITGETVGHTGAVTNSKYPNALFSPDGFTVEGVIARRLLEVKCFAEKQHRAIFAAKGPMEIPLKILAQIHFGMVIMEVRQARLIIYNPKLETKYAFKFFDIPYDPRINERFVTILGAAHG